jgi:hypothetical protein
MESNTKKDTHLWTAEIRDKNGLTSFLDFCTPPKKSNFLACKSHQKPNDIVPTMAAAITPYDHPPINLWP